MSLAKQQAHEKLKRVLKEELYKCIRCGECRTVCPVYRERFAERYTARGKMLIIDGLVKGELEFTPSSRESIENCLLCTGCANICSSGVRADRVILAAREAFAEELGIPAKKKAITTAMRSKKIMDSGTKMGSMVQKLLFKKVPQTSGLYRRFQMPVIDDKQYVPEIASPSFRERVDFASVGGDKNVIFFTGCMANYFMPEVSDSLVKVLNKLGVNVLIPKEQGCCGMPMITSGDANSVKIAAMQNIKALANLDDNTPIVVACGSCGHMLSHGYLDFFGENSEYALKLKNISERTMDISKYLLTYIGEDKIKAALKHDRDFTLTYHDPCHLRKAQKIVDEPRALLNMASGDNLKEMTNPEACCGLGGTYTISHLKTSKDIQKHKIEDAINTNASCLATACPGCIIQLRDGLRRENNDMQVKHLVQILAESLK